MPIYEFRCNSCNKVASALFRSFSTPVEATCLNCNGSDMTRLISRVAILKPALERLQDREPRRLMGKLEDRHDLRAIERWAKMAGEMDEDLGTNFREMAHQITGEDDRPYDLYDPLGSYQMALENRMRQLEDEQFIKEMGGDEGPGDEYRGAMLGD